jgi:hypothetical protein
MEKEELMKILDNDVDAVIANNDLLKEVVADTDLRNHLLELKNTKILDVTIDGNLVRIMNLTRKLQNTAPSTPPILSNLDNSV